MMPEMTISKIMRAGLGTGLLFMLAGILLTITGRYNEHITPTLGNLLSGALFLDGAGLMYLGTVFIILTPVAVLGFLSIFYIFSDMKRYSLYCLSILFVLIIVVLVRV